MTCSSSASRSSWPRYDIMPMTKCPDCPRIAPLKRFVTMMEKNGNNEKCKSKPEEGSYIYFPHHHFSLISANFLFFSSNLRFRVLLSDSRLCQNVGILSGWTIKWRGFKWIECSIDLKGGASGELKLPSTVDKLGPHIVASVGVGSGGRIEEVEQELKENYWPEHANVMAALFYVCVISLGFMCSMLISR
jgi:hypothetical protein